MSQSPNSNNQIYVGDIPESADEAFISSMFKECGPIIPGGIVLKQHKALKRKYAFITFEQHESAQRALSEMNYTKLDGIPIRISWSDPETKKIKNSGLGNLFIRGLDENIEVSQLHEAFSNFGDIISCKIPLNDDGKSRGYGYIQFRSPQDAERARIDLQDASINGKPITIMEYKKPTKADPETSFTNVFFKAPGKDAKLPEQLRTQEGVEAFFNKYGKIAKVGTTLSIAVQDAFGFVNFESHDDAVNAVAETNDKEAFGVKLYVSRAMLKRERQAIIKKKSEEYHRMINEQTKGRNLYVKGFGEDIAAEDFDEYFQQFGELEKTCIKEDPETKKSKGFGFVLFKTKEGAEKCLEEAALTKFKDGSNPPYVALFMTKEDREFRKQKEQRQRQQQQGQQQGNQLMYNQAQVQSMIQQYVNQALAAQKGVEHAESNTMVPTAFTQAMMMSPAAGTMQQTSAKDKLKAELLNHDISGQKLKAKLSSISEDQAKALCDNEEQFQEWIKQE